MVLCCHHHKRTYIPCRTQVNVVGFVLVTTALVCQDTQWRKAHSCPMLLSGGRDGICCPLRYPSNGPELLLLDKR